MPYSLEIFASSFSVTGEKHVTISESNNTFFHFTDKGGILSSPSDHWLTFEDFCARTVLLSSKIESELQCLYGRTVIGDEWIIWKASSIFETKIIEYIPGVDQCHCNPSTVTERAIEFQTFIRILQCKIVIAKI